MAKIIAIANQKGGVGKTTTAVNLAACVGALNKKVLVIDSDPQGNATSGLGIDKNEVSKNYYDVLMEGEPIENTVVSTDYKNVSVIPGNMDLLGVEVSLDKIDNKEYILKNSLSQYQNDFDYIFIDCPPSLNYVTINAFTAADSIIIPIQCEYYALEGVSDLIENIKLIKNSLNPILEIEGILLTMFDTRTNLSIQVAQDVKDCFPEKVYKVAIPRNTRLGEAPSFGTPILYYDKYSKGAESYKALAKEFLKQNK